MNKLLEILNGRKEKTGIRKETAEPDITFLGKENAIIEPLLQIKQRVFCSFAEHQLAGFKKGTKGLNNKPSNVQI
jgi:hypothetical protein